MQHTAPTLIVDDHPLFRDALKMALASTQVEGSILEAGSLAEAAEILAAGPVALVLLDLHLDDCDGFKGLMAIRKGHPDTPVILCSASEDHAVVRQAIRLGAAGFIPKSEPLDQIVGAISQVLAGEVWVPSSAALQADDSDKADADAKLSQLTPAQMRVLDGVVEGRLNKQIAYDMSISEATVKAHMTAIFRKLGVTNRTQVVLMAQSLKVADPSHDVQPG